MCGCTFLFELSCPNYAHKTIYPAQHLHKEINTSVFTHIQVITQ